MMFVKKDGSPRCSVFEPCTLFATPEETVERVSQASLCLVIRTTVDDDHLVVKKGNTPYPGTGFHDL